ncbi:MAG TPA: helix-turn-helix domain-containing protein [Paludibacteraceae bacterium]|jgi:hypothetical protein|nr:helix-turn-helix domain-containing protein [Paludibacteraceae bacterium]
MSQPKLLRDILLEMAEDTQNPFSKMLRSCPFVQSALLQKGVISLDDLNDAQLDNLVEHSFLEDWIDNQVVMQSLHISLRTLQTLRSNGTLPYTRVNGKIYYLRKDVEALLRKNYGKKGGCK